VVAAVVAFTPQEHPETAEVVVAEPEVATELTGQQVHPIREEAAVAAEQTQALAVLAGPAVKGSCSCVTDNRQHDWEQKWLISQN